MVWSEDPEARVRPSGDHATLKTVPECPVSVRRTLPVEVSQSLMVLSHDPEARVRPSGAHATL